MTRKALKPTLVLILFFTLISVSYAQDTIPSLLSKPRNPDNFWHRVAIGGNIGLQFGSTTSITVSPEVRIRTIDQLYVGFRFIYQYLSFKNYFYDTVSGGYLSYKTNVFGGSVYLRYYMGSLFTNFLSNLFVHAEYEYISYHRPFVQSDQGTLIGADNYLYKNGKSVVAFNSLFLGGGYRQPITKSVSLDLLILFNINDTYSSPYTNPIFRLGVSAGL